MKRAVLLALLLPILACEREVVYPDGLSWGEPPAAPYADALRVALTNNGDDTIGYVSAEEPDRPRLLGLAPVGKSPVELEGPHHLSASPDGRFIYFNLSNYVIGGGGGPHGAHGTGSVPGYVVKLDARTHRPLGQALVDRSPGDLIISADGRLLYVSHYDLQRLQQQLARNQPPEQGFSSVAIIDSERMQVLSMTPLCPTAHGQGLSPDGRRLYVTCAHSDEVAVLDVSRPEQPRLVQKVKVGPEAGPHGMPRYAPYALAVHPSGAVWVSNNESQDVWVLDPQALTTRRAGMGLGGLAMFGAFSMDGAVYYVPSQGREDRVSVIDTGSLAPLGSALLPRDVCLNAHEVVRVPSGLALVCEGDHRTRKGTLVFLSAEHQPKVRGFVETGIFPDRAVLLPPAPH